MLAVTAAQMALVDGVAVSRDGASVLVRLAGAAIAQIAGRYRGEVRSSPLPATATTEATPSRR